jgi:tetratricopeptide (TPR) repeat protein
MRDTDGRRRTAGAMVLAAALFCLLPVAPAAAMTASETFEDGNRLFRDELYWAALLRYRQAQDAGMDTPLLHYNMGVAHYRARQYGRAHASLLEAAQSPGLRVLSHYNLGLTAYAAGDMDDALNWFRQARDQEENAKIRKYAIIAISRIQAERRAADPILVRVEKRLEKKKIGEFDLFAHVGFGSDDNVYRTPNQPYIDFADPNLPLVTPEAISGVYMPLDFLSRYSVNSLKYESFFGEYRLAGRYYQDKELDNANEFSHELRFGSEYDRSEETRSTRIYSAFTIAQHDETYYDPDDGISRTVNGELIDERMNYVRYGPELAVRRSHERWAYGLRAKGQVWDYTQTDVVPEYDHEYFLLGVNLQYRFTETSLLRLTIDKSSRRFGDRPSFDLNGQQLITNPAVRYDYLDVALLARQRITRNMWFGFGYEFSDRSDTYVGYNDYTRDNYTFEFHWSPGDRFRLDLKSYYRIYDYPNAFAFNNPAAGSKTLETADGIFSASYRMTPHLSIVAEAEYRGTSSTDTRIAYDRNFYSLGVTWQQ